MAIRSYKDLTVWQKSIDFVEEVYKVTAQLPSTERFGLSSQLQRAAVSIGSNIAEGSKRGSRADFRQFCRIAQGSAAEAETQLIVIRRLYPGIDCQNPVLLLEQIQRMLTALTRSLGHPPLSTIN